MKNILKKIKATFISNTQIYTVATILSIVNLLLFHLPFYSYIFDNINGDFNGVLIVVCMVAIMLTANFMAFYLLLYLFRIVGKIILAITFILSSVAIYFINTYEVMLDDTMMGNVFNTQYSEASSYASWAAIGYIVCMGIIPCIYIFATRINYNTFKRFLANIGVSLGIIIIVAFGNAPNWTWIDKHAPVIGSLLMPWSYIVNSVRWKVQFDRNNRQEILLPDATIANDEKSVVVLVIGESDRRDHFSLYGYKKETNPLLSQTENIKCFDVNSSATYTTAGVKAMLEHIETDELYEILPNYLNRAGVDVVWRTTNWGEPPLHIEQYTDLKWCNEDSCKYDNVLLKGLKQHIDSCKNSKIFIVLHSSTSHGPSYNLKYPAEFEKFTPVCTSVELSNCSTEELNNAYDNTIVYTDFLLHSLIDTLKTLPDWKSTMLFVSDHGESLGEKNLYMHGVPLSIAPKEQYEIPFIVWTSDGEDKVKDNISPSQHSVFHSVLFRLGVNSPVYNEDMNIFKQE